jgi:hypothetical protein
MDSMDELVARIKARTAEPMRAREADAWVEPIDPVPPPATEAEVDAAEAALGFPLPSLLRRLYLEVGNGGWGPVYGFQGIPTGGAEPDENDLVGFYQQFVAPERALEHPAVLWPRGLVVILSHGCVTFEVCDFLSPPYPVLLLDDSWDPERPVAEGLLPVAPSLAERLELWLAGSE